VLRVDDHKDLSAAVPLIAKTSPERAGPQQRYEASAAPMMARDSFVAETALKLEQLQATVRLLSRDVGQLAGKVAELQEVTAQENRWYTFQQNDKRSRDGKLDEMVRSFRDLKTRLDRMEARSDGDYHAYNSFEAVSRKLGEIERASEKAKGGRGDTLRACLLAGAMLAAAGIIGLSLVLSGGSV
jgi:chromosome segregation ATPase